MTRLIAIPAALAAFLAAPLMAPAQDTTDDTVVTEAAIEEPGVIERWTDDPTLVFDAAEVDLDALRYLARPVIVFADSPADPLFVQQMELLTERPEGLIARDVILIVDTDSAARTDTRAELRPRGFTLVLIGKDGRVAQRKPAPFDVRELERAIDKMPLRQQEIRDGRALSE